MLQRIAVFVLSLAVAAAMAGCLKIQKDESGKTKVRPGGVEVKTENKAPDRYYYEEENK